MNEVRSPSSPVEHFVTINDAARLLGIPAWKLRRAAAAGLIRSYKILNQRRLVRIGDIEAVLAASGEGGE